MRRNQAGLVAWDALVTLAVLLLLAAAGLPLFLTNQADARRGEATLMLDDLIRLQQANFGQFEYYAPNLKAARFVGRNGQAGFVDETLYRGKHYRVWTHWLDPKGKKCVVLVVGNIDSDAFEDVFYAVLSGKDSVKRGRLQDDVYNRISGKLVSLTDGVDSATSNPPLPDAIKTIKKGKPTKAAAKGTEKEPEKDPAPAPKKP